MIWIAYSRPFLLKAMITMAGILRHIDHLLRLQSALKMCHSNEYDALRNHWML